MAELDHDVLELILKTQSLTDLIRFRSVCKSWNDLISDSRFHKTHMNHSYHSDCNNNDVEMRIVMGRVPYQNTRGYEFNDKCFDYRECHLLGSSNGLVCISPFATQILVANPLTREVRRLKDPKIPHNRLLCWGFGYDSSTDDYKVILGFPEGDGLTCFQVITLRSNVWKVIGYVNCSIESRIGILCNGALHWVMKDVSSQKYNKNVILSFHLSEEKFKEISQPDDVRYESGIAHLPTMRLGITEERLCLLNYGCLLNSSTRTDKIWMMKNYNDKGSWEMVGKDRGMKFFVHRLKELKHYIGYKSSLVQGVWHCRTQDYIVCPIYVQSLVSPHVNGSPKRKKPANDTRKSYKKNKGDPLVAGPSTKVIGC